MINELSTAIIKTLMQEMQAVTPEGEIDHKTRMQALKEARAMVLTILPKLSDSDRAAFSEAMSKELTVKLDDIRAQEDRLAALQRDESTTTS